MFRTRLWPPIVPLPVVAVDPVWLVLWLELQLWLNSCHGTGINLPVVVDPEALEGVPEMLDRLDGVVSRPEVEVSVDAPADDSDRMAKSIRPLCGSTMTSRK